jgi:ABC-type Fe3+-hydroxamate transport system substrate-binding protein
MPGSFTDQVGNTFHLAAPPKRIVTAVPSQTELLFDLKLQNKIVGITKFCVHPRHAKSEKTIVGGTKNLRLEKIASLNPDFILANKEENDREQIEWLQARFPTYISDVRKLEHAFGMIRDVGCVTETVDLADEIIQTISNRFGNILLPKSSPSVAYLIWKNPWMTVNKDTFIHDMLQRSGFNNVFAELKESRYPILTEEELRSANPDFIFLSSEPFPFNDSHTREIADIVPNSKVHTVDGEMFSWYGSRLRHFNTNLIHELF